MMDRLDALAAMLNKQPGPFHDWRVGAETEYLGQLNGFPDFRNVFKFLGTAMVNGAEKVLVIWFDQCEYEYVEDEAIVYKVTSDADYFYRKATGQLTAAEEAF